MLQNDSEHGEKKLYKKSKWSQDKRLEFIDFRLNWEGRINRNDLIGFFGISTPQASLDLARYIDSCPNNIFYDKKQKFYVATEEFEPIYPSKGSNYYLSSILAINQGVLNPEVSLVGYLPQHATVPTPERVISEKILKVVLKAIKAKIKISVKYLSMRRPEPKLRSLSPHALVYDGYRWHVRAYCDDRQEFRDFVLARILEALPIDEAGIPKEKDLSWNNILKLLFVPDHTLSEFHQNAIAYDYGMTEGKIEIECRQALLLYALRRFNLLNPRNDSDNKFFNLNDHHITLANRDEIQPYIIKEMHGT